MMRAAVVLLAAVSAVADLDLWLKRRVTDAELEKLLFAVSDPKSPAYGQFYSQKALAGLVGAHPATVEKLVTHLTSVEGIPAHRITVAPTSDRITIADHAALKAPLPAGLKHEVTLMHSKVPKTRRSKTSVSRQETLRKLHAGAAPFGAPEVREAYGIPDTVVGAREVQLVWGPGTYDVGVSDVETYWKHFGVNNKAANLEFVGYAHGNQTAGDNFEEASLDTDIISGMAPNATTIVSNTNDTSAPEEGPGFGYAQLAFLNELNTQANVPGVVSLSLGSLTYKSCDMLCQRVEQSGAANYTACLEYVQYDQRQVCMFQNDAVIQLANQEFMKLGLRGVTVLAAAGDGGMHFSFEPFDATNALGRALNKVACSLTMPTFPASSPYVTAVGGTQWTGDGTKEAPAYWKGGGSGFSWDFPMPDYQKTVVNAYLAAASGDAEFPEADAFNASLRAYPDVSALAGGNGLVVNGRVLSAGGTSAAAPTMSGVVTLLNAHRTAVGKARLGFWNIALYQQAALHADEMFFDVVLGNSKCNCITCLTCTKGFPAYKGFDLATGWGAPRWAGLSKYFA